MTELFFNLTEKEIEEDEKFNPLDVARNVIKLLTELIDDLLGYGKGQFNEQFLKKIDEQRANVMANDIINGEFPFLPNQTLEIDAKNNFQYAIYCATVFAVSAIKEYEAGRTRLAFFYVLYAERYYGFACGLCKVIQIPKIVKSELGRASQKKNKRQKTSKEAKAFCLKYYTENISNFSTKTEAAIKITEKINKIWPELKIQVETIKDSWIPSFHKADSSLKNPQKTLPD